MNKNLTPKRLTQTDVWRIAEEFRQKYVNPHDLIPVPIEEIIEFKLRLSIVSLKSLKSSCDIEGFIGCDLKTIYVDYDTYNDDRYINRLRFTYAHEVGHLILHPEEIRQLKFRNKQDWIDFNLAQNDENIEWFERQAKQFAGRLLVPKDKLIEFIEQLRPKIDAYRETYSNNEDLLLDYVARSICKPFAVSHDVIKRRINSEHINL